MEGSVQILESVLLSHMVIQYVYFVEWLIDNVIELHTILITITNVHFSSVNGLQKECPTLVTVYHKIIIIPTKVLELL